MPLTYDLYDLTGANPLYKRSDRRFVVYTTDQKIELGEPAYAASLKVWAVAAGGGTTLLSKPTHYFWSAINNADQTSTAKAKAQLEIGTSDTWPPNGDTIIRSFSMTDLSVPEEYQIVVEYQSLYRDPAAVDNYDSIGPVYSPGLMRSLLLKVDYLLSVKNPTNTVTSDTLDSIRCLDEDRTGTLSANYILDEQHTVNIPNNRFVIRPVNGSFYKHDLIIKDATNAVLTENVDYLALGVNHGKIKISTPNSGVYEYIVVTKPVVGVLRVSYRAFGGSVGQRDINALRDTILSLLVASENTAQLTGDSIRNSDIVANIISRLDYIDETIRHYQMQSFEYTLNENGVNPWVDVATIEKNPWSDAADIEVAATGSFHLSIGDGAYFSDIELAYNTTLAAALQLKVPYTHMSTYKEDGIAYFDNRITPVFRLLWNGHAIDSGTSYNFINDGIVLQMKLIGAGARTATVSIKDKSGANSPWDLVDTGGVARSDGTTTTAYPGTAIREWSASTQTDMCSNICPLFPEGYTIFAGVVRITDIEAASYISSDDTPYDLPVEAAGLVLPVVFDTALLDLNNIRAMRFTVYDRLTGNKLEEETTQIHANTETELHAYAMYYLPDMCGLECVLNTTSGLTLFIKSRSGTNSLLNDRFELLAIDIIS